MSLQDDVFDVQEALKGTPEQRAFERIEAALWKYEAGCERYRKIMDAARSGFWAVQEVMGKND
jgi:hypothetical protein